MIAIADIHAGWYWARYAGLEIEVVRVRELEGLGLHAYSIDDGGPYDLDRYEFIARIEPPAAA